MDAREPLCGAEVSSFTRRDGSEPETGEHENAEGVAIRVRIVRSPAPRQFGSKAARLGLKPGRSEKGVPRSDLGA